ncbi:MAG: type II toxin-antitoxin system RelE/ParE family toxin [Chloroflexota bacterium]|nr:type II toxin-antitoxin system RelE/ParE family toxin [Chloroflexota bacterium]
MNFDLEPRAQVDLENIWDYTADRWDSGQADDYVGQITQTCAELAAGTRSGRDMGIVRPHYFKYPVGSHVVYYRFGRNNRLAVVRILHQRMDVTRHL